MNHEDVIDRSSPVPVFRQVYDWMVQNIASGVWPASTQIPAEPILAETLGINRGTLRKTVALLVQENLLVQVQGKGTFVTAGMISQPLASRLTSVSEELIRAGTPFTTKVLSQEVRAADAGVAESLLLEPASKVLYLERVRSVGGQPVLLNESYLSAARFGSLAQHDFAEQRLFEVLENEFDVRLARARRTITALTASSAVSKALGTSPGLPVLFSEQVVFDSDDTPVEYSRAWFRGDRFQLTSEATRAAEDPVHSVTLPNQWEFSTGGVM